MLSSNIPPPAVGNYLILEELGAGSFARVYRCEHTLTHKQFAGKLYEVDFAISDEGCKLVRKEISIMKLLRHEHVVRFEEVVSNRSWMLIVMELVEGRTLLSVMPSSGGLPESFARLVMKQILDAIDFLHCNGIVHRDMKLENIMIQNDGTVKVIDFGLADYIHEEYKKEGLLIEGQCGSPHYYAPEMILARGESMFRGDKVDIWATGVLLYSLVTGFHPFFAEDDNQAALFAKILGDKVPYDNNISKELEDLLRKVLVKIPSKRTTLYGMRSHPWMNETLVVSPAADTVLSRRVENTSSGPNLTPLNIQTDCFANGTVIIPSTGSPSNHSVENKWEPKSDTDKPSDKKREEELLSTKRSNTSSSIIELKLWNRLKGCFKDLVSNCKKHGLPKETFPWGTKKTNSSTLTTNENNSLSSGRANGNDRNSFAFEHSFKGKSLDKENDDPPHNRIHKISFACWMNV